jgi:TolA-binding protein
MIAIKKDIASMSCSGLLACGFALLTGCQSLAGPRDVGSPLDAGGPNPVSQAAAQDDGRGNPVAQVSGELTLAEKAKKNSTRVMNFVTGREQEDIARAKQLYQEADALFRTADSQSEKLSKGTFAKSAKIFGRAGEAAPGTALEQDALFMQGESLFFADRLTEAAEVYQKLQKEHPRNRHDDRVAARLFSISRYWIETVKADDGGWFKINLTDSKRPRIDTDGHAIRVLDQIRYDDPTGRLADDATMAAAAEYIRQKKFEAADEFLTDLRETFSDSEHLFLAHLLGIRCKLEVYAGPRYSGLILEEAETLVKQTRQRFPDKLGEKEYGDMVARAAAEIAYMRAERLIYRADYREKRKEYGAARYYYNQLLQQFPETPQAEIARKRLSQVEELPAVPEQRLSWLTTIFPDEKRSKPLETITPSGGEPAKTMLR